MMVRVMVWWVVSAGDGMVMAQVVLVALVGWQQVGEWNGHGRGAWLVLAELHQLLSINTLDS
jgi:hypothetical protein